MISDLSAKLFKRYHSDKHFSVFTYKMAAKINWHRYGTKLRHCHPMYRGDGALLPCESEWKFSGPCTFTIY